MPFRFVTCLFAGILITNLNPKNLPTLSGMPWPTRTPAIALIADGRWAPSWPCRYRPGQCAGDSDVPAEFLTDRAT